LAEVRKTAVILVHGIGEQRPMDTLWSFIDAAWSKDRSLVAGYDNTVYSKPDVTSDNFELRRVTTRYFDPPDPRRVDFFEYYWAHMMIGNTVAGIGRWIASLFFRSPQSIPRAYLPYWIAGWLVGLAITIAIVAWQLLSGDEADHRLWWTLLPGLIGPALTSVIVGMLVPYVGDAARYLRAEPDNVEARQRIRAGGVELLRKLTESGEYDRIVLVGHSLGSVIAYDILTQAWAQLDPLRLQALHAAGSPLLERLTALEKAGAVLEAARRGGDSALEETALPAWRNAQRAYRRALAGVPEAPWLVSDLVTLGSPLGKADLLLADDAAAFERRKNRREFPVDPPLFEYWSERNRQFSYPEGKGARIPHHAAPFAPTVWTNHWFPTSLLVLGDPISGPVARHFGAGVKDVKLPGKRLRFQHLDYWTRTPAQETTPAVEALRQALNLRDLDE
jgi:hypothetical protein